MEKGAQFGQEFNPDATNRLDVLKNIEDLPEYVETSREIRDQLRASVETQGWPPLPQRVEGLEDLFAQSRATVTEYWARGASQVLERQIPEWLNRIPDTAAYQEVRKILADPSILEGNVQQQQLGMLESLRGVAPDAWRTLVLAASERQLAAVVLLRKWLPDLTDQQFGKMGISRDELGLFLDASGWLGKYFDQAHVKQIELADAPGGSVKSPLGDRTGAEYLYDVKPNPDSDQVALKSYGDVFAYEWPKIVKRLEALAAKTETMLADEKLPASYRALPGYVRQIAHVYDSESVSPKNLEQLWRDLYAQGNALAVEGCPLMFIPQGCSTVAGEANKVDIEMRLGFQTKETRALSKFYNGYRPIAQALIDERKDALAQQHTVPSVVLNVQPFAFGSNLYFMTPAESGKESILSHTNVMEEVAASKEFPVLDRAFSALPVDIESYKKAALHEAVLHELGHNVLHEDDQAVRSRIGRGSEWPILEELKAETVGMVILEKRLSGMDPAEADRLAEQQLSAKLGANSHYLAHESDEKGSGGSGTTTLAPLF